LGFPGGTSKVTLPTLELKLRDHLFRGSFMWFMLKVTQAGIAPAN